MTTIARRIAVTAALFAAPALIALGTAAASQAETTAPGTSISAPTHHEAFPQQSNTPQPGTQIHHHKHR